MYEQHLKNIGLSEKEIKVYLAALEFGSMTVQQLAHQTSIGRTTVYVEIASLTKKGFMSRAEKDGRTYFVAEMPDALERLFEQRIKSTRHAYNQFKKILPKLKILAEDSGIKPQVRFFEDKEGIKNIHRDIIKSRASTMEEFISIDPETLLFPFHPDDHRNRIAKRYKKIRVIYTSKKGAFLPHRQGPREWRFVPFSQFPFDGELVIYGEKVTLLIPGKKKIGVIIEHRSVAEMLRNLFNLAWKEAERFSEKPQSA